MNEAQIDDGINRQHEFQRTPSQFVRDAFGFLSHSDYNIAEGNGESEHVNGYSGIKSSTSEPVIAQLNPGYVPFAKAVGMKDRDKKYNGFDKDEFTIVTTIEEEVPAKCQEPHGSSHVEVPEHSAPHSSEEFTIVTYVEDNNTAKQPLKHVEINPVYVADNDSEILLPNSDKGVDSRMSNSNKDISRNSVIIDGQEVELRSSPGEVSTRKSRQLTWRKNQRAVSDAFDFLKDLDEDAARLSIEEGDTVGELNGDNGDQGIEADIPEQDAENKDEESDYITCIPDPVDLVKPANSLENLDEVNSVSSNEDELKELRGRIPRRGRPKDTGDDDGGSSDEDKGVYRESFRKSTWLYIGSNSDAKRGIDPKDYVALSDLGLSMCDDDGVFGDENVPPPTPVLLEARATHKRNDSTATTVSEKEFRKQFNSVSKRFVKRADSQQEYRRYTAKFYDHVKTHVLQRGADSGFGIHVLDSKPAVVSGVDEGSPAEKAGVKQGQVVIAVNGVNVLDSDHDEIIRLVKQNTQTLTLEVGGSDQVNIHDLEVPVCTGYLMKQTSSTIFRSWKKRYFILRRDNCLYYYKTEQDTDPLGAIPLSCYAVSRHGDLNKFGFKAEKYNNRTFYFQADTRQDMTKWVGAMNEAAQRGKDKRDAWMDVTTHNVGLPALEIRKPDCSGYLFKMGRSTKRWRKRYCVLKDACIYYYKNANSKAAEGVAHLHGYTMNWSDVNGKRNSFSLHPPESQMRVFSFYTDNDTDKNRWLTALGTSINKWVKVE